jgi:hypothetical protein
MTGPMVARIRKDRTIKSAAPFPAPKIRDYYFKMIKKQRSQKGFHSPIHSCHTDEMREIDQVLLRRRTGLP